MCALHIDRIFRATPRRCDTRGAGKEMFVCRSIATMIGVLSGDKQSAIQHRNSAWRKIHQKDARRKK